MRIIAIEEHFITKNYMDYLRARQDYPILKSTVDEKKKKFWQLWHSPEESRPWYSEFNLGILSDIGDERIRKMDENGIDLQLLSFNDNIDHLNAADATDVTRRLNDELAEAVHRHASRFAGLATLAPKDPDAAAVELERAVAQLGLKGTMMLPHVEGEFIDAEKYWPIFGMAARLGVPIYIHPVYPSPDRLKQYSGYPELGGALWGYGAEASLIAMRLICSGVFDEFPELTIILGHMGEGLPFWMWRIDNRLQRPTHTTSPLCNKLKKLPSQYLRANFYFTTSGMLSQPALLCALLTMGADKILFATDFPHEDSAEAVQFMATAPISEGDREKIYHLNAERLLGL